MLILIAFGAGCLPTATDEHRRPGAVPEPRPVSTRPHQVGAYYFPGWPTRDKWRVLDAFPERIPLLGYYREGDPAVMDWQIKWAVEHGISFFAFDWYWDRGARQLEHALHDGYLRAQFRRYLKFCLLWANHNPPGSSSAADLIAVTDHWIAQYFHRPEYLTVQAKPVVIVFSPRRLREDLGTDGVRDGIAAMRARARERGLAGLFVMGAARESRDGLLALSHEGYDAATGYNYPRAGMADEHAREAPYDDVVDGYERIWYTIAAHQVIDYVPVTDPGWDSRPWHGATALVRTGRAPKKFADMLKRARAFTDRHPIAGGGKLVLIEAWNEYGEGAAIEPHRQWGFSYLDAVRTVFAPAAAGHVDVTPADLGLAVPEARGGP